MTLLRKTLSRAESLSTRELGDDQERRASEAPRRRWLKIATSNLDRAGDILLISGMDATNFLRNPQFLWQHGRSGAEISSIGSIVELVPTPTALYALAEYAPADLSPLAEQVYQLDLRGYLPANSIGFRPIEWSDNEYGGITFTKWELIECSKVELPMNPHAVDDGPPHSRSLTTDEALRWLRRRWTPLRVLTSASLNTHTSLCA